jgi:hypothetical protein
VSKDPRDRRSADEIAREHENIQREVERAKPTEGGLTAHDQLKVAEQQLVPDFDRADREDRERMDRVQQEWDHEHGVAASGATAEPEAAGSILDSVEPSDSRSRIAEAFGGGAAGRSVRDRSRERLVMRVAALGLGLAGVFLLWQALQSQQGAVPSPTVAPATATATAITAPTRSAVPSIQVTAPPTTTAGIGIVCGLPGGPSCPPRP